MKASRIVNAETNSKQNKTLKEESRVKTLLTTTLIILILFVAVPFSHASYQVTQLTTDTYDDLKPQINYTGEVVYEKHLAGDSEIYMHNGAGEYNVSRRSSFSDYNPQINSGGNVLWESEVQYLRFIFVKPPNFAFDFAISPPDPNNPPQILPLKDWGPTYPQFNDNNQVVLRGFTNLYKDHIWLYGSPNNYNQLTMNCGGTGYPVLGQMDKHPQINANGLVVWQGGVNNDCDPLLQNYFYDIFLYNGNSPPINISKSVVNDEYPQINDNGTVVWERDGEIYRYTGGDPEKISNSPEYSNFAAQIINQCGYVVWQGCNEFDCEIFLYNGYSAVNISNDPGHRDEYPQINEKGQVVWVKDYSCGDGPCNIDNIGQEVMLYNHYDKTVVNISNRIGDDEDPQINDNGEVVWSGYHQGNWEIFKATPVSITAAPVSIWEADDVLQTDPVDKMEVAPSLCESVSNFSSSSAELQLQEEKIKIKTSQESTNVTKTTSATPLRIGTESLSIR